MKTPCPPRRPPPCHCAAYPFPHRNWGGACRTGPREMVCAACGLPADTRPVDHGIGSYEFWGDRGFHEDWYYDTTCCEAALTPNTAKEAARRQIEAREVGARLAKHLASCTPPPAR